MNIYGIKFREKGETNYITILIPALSEIDLKQKFDKWLVDEGKWYDIDRRTISWSGDSIPLSSRGEPFVIATNLDGLT